MTENMRTRVEKAVEAEDMQKIIDIPAMVKYAPLTRNNDRAKQFNKLKKKQECKKKAGAIKNLIRRC